MQCLRPIPLSHGRMRFQRRVYLLGVAIGVFHDVLWGVALCFFNATVCRTSPSGSHQPHSHPTHIVFPSIREGAAFGRCGHLLFAFGENGWCICCHRLRDVKGSGQQVIIHLDELERGLSRALIHRRNTRNWLTNIVDVCFSFQQIGYCHYALKGLRCGKINSLHAGVGMGRTQNFAFELVGELYINGVFGFTRHFRQGIHAGCNQFGHVIKFPGTRLGDGGIDAHIGGAAAQMPTHGDGDFVW